MKRRQSPPPQIEMMFPRRSTPLKTGDVLVTLDIPSPLHAELSARARREGRTLETVVRELVCNGSRA